MNLILITLQKVPAGFYLEQCSGHSSLRKRKYKGLQGRSEEKGLLVKRGLEDLGVFSVIKVTVKREG